MSCQSLLDPVFEPHPQNLDAFPACVPGFTSFRANAESRQGSPGIGHGGQQIWLEKKARLLALAFHVEINDHFLGQ